MKKKNWILIIVGLLACCTVVLVALLVKNSDQEIMSQRKAGRMVEILKKNIKVPVDETTRQRITELTQKLTLEYDRKFVDVDGKEYAVSSVSLWELRKMRESALPQLIDTAKDDPNPRIRAHALGIIYLVCKDMGNDYMEYLPVFVRSTYDKHHVPRITGVGQIGKIAAFFYMRKQQEKLETLIPYLVRALKYDEDEVIRVTAGENLYRIGREDLVPADFAKKYGLGTYSH